MHTEAKFRLLVVRLGSMGDILHALPAVTALRVRHPDWEIGWVLEPRWRALLTAGIADQGSGVNRANSPAQPVVDRVHFAPAKEWGRRPLSIQTAHEIKALRAELRASNYNAVIDLQGAIRSAVIARMAGSKRVIGEAEPRERIARWLFNERVKTRGAHVIEQDVELVSAIADDALATVPPLLPVDPAAEDWCDALLAPTAGQPVALINPGAGWGAKRWPVERYAAVAEGLVKRGLRVLVNAGPGEEPLATAIKKGTNGAATAMTPTLEQLIASPGALPCAWPAIPGRCTWPAHWDGRW